MKKVTLSLIFAATLLSAIGHAQDAPKIPLAISPAPQTGAWWMPRHVAKLRRIQQGYVDLLMIGDSITHGWERTGSAVWDQYYADRKAVNLGFSGDRTEHVLWRLEHGEVELAVYNLAGQRVASLVEGHRAAGSYKVNWDGRDAAGRELASGMYLYRLRSSAGQMATRKFLLLR